MKVKYPRTPHLPWSPGFESDDTKLGGLDHFAGREVVVTEKMDGENTSIYRDGVHARSIDGRHHPSRDWVKQKQGEIGYLIPDGWRLCGENLYAKHSIGYEELAGYFYLFSVWTDENRCLDWDETLAWADKFSLPTPKEIYRGEFDLKVIESIDVDTEISEGYVMRTVEGFSYDEFSEHVAKWVRRNHVTTDQHWMTAQVVPNGLRDETDS